MSLKISEESENAFRCLKASINQSESKDILATPTSTPINQKNLKNS